MDCMQISIQAKAILSLISGHVAWFPFSLNCRAPNKVTDVIE